MCKSVDDQGQSVWFKRFIGQQDYDPTEITAAQDGGVVICGRLYDGHPRGYDAVITKLDADGNLVWEKTWGNEWEAGVYAITQLQSGEIVAKGTYRPVGMENGTGWTIVLDNDGNEIEQSYNIVKATLGHSSALAIGANDYLLFGGDRLYRCDRNHEASWVTEPIPSFNHPIMMSALDGDTGFFPIM